MTDMIGVIRGRCIHLRDYELTLKQVTHDCELELTIAIREHAGFRGAAHGRVITAREALNLAMREYRFAQGHTAEARWLYHKFVGHFPEED